LKDDSGAQPSVDNSLPGPDLEASRQQSPPYYACKPRCSTTMSVARFTAVFGSFRPDRSHVLDVQVTPISDEDYFAKNAEFSLWLRDLQHIHFNELTAEASREQFKVCCSHWQPPWLCHAYVPVCSRPRLVQASSRRFAQRCLHT
jgi:hypothetical protein